MAATIVVHIVQDTTIYKEEIEKLCVGKNGQEWKPLFLLVPLRLGIDTLNPGYFDQLKVQITMVMFMPLTNK
jgi:hypothetical protein